MWYICKCNCWLIIEVIQQNVRCNNTIYAVFDLMRTVPTAQHVEQVPRHMPRGCSDRHPEISRRMINITS